MAKVQISVADDVLFKVDEYAKQVGLSRSALLSTSVLEYIDSRKKAPLVTEAFSSFASLLDSRVKGDISESDFQLRLDSINQSLDELKAK